MNLERRIERLEQEIAPSDGNSTPMFIYPADDAPVEVWEKYKEELAAARAIGSMPIIIRGVKA